MILEVTHNRTLTHTQKARKRKKTHFLARVLHKNNKETKIKEIVVAARRDMKNIDF